MRMQSKVYAWMAALLFGFVATGLVFASIFPEHFGFVQLACLMWVIGAASSQVWFLTCPHCGRLSTVRPTGIASPNVGATCAHCHKEY